MIEVNIYLWIAIIICLVFSVVYINHLLKRVRVIEATFTASMELITSDMIKIEDKLNDLNHNQEIISDHLSKQK